MMCKGAESSVLQKCVSGPIDETIEHVDYYAGVCIQACLPMRVGCESSALTLSNIV